MSGESAWVRRFDPDQDDAALRRRMRVPACVTNGLARLASDQAAQHLRHALKKVVVPNKQMVDIIRRLISVAKAYCEIAYPDSRSVLQRIYSPAERIGSSDTPATCITGLAGTGKSAILEAFVRMHDHAAHAEVPDHSRFDLRACWHLQIRDRATLRSLVLPQFRAPQHVIAPGVVAIKTISEAAAQGVALLLGDEFQFITQSEANVMAAKLLLQLTRIGPPPFYACNYSLVHRLMKRPQQERDRLLQNPIVLGPDSLDDDWVETGSELFRVTEEYSRLSPESDGEVLHKYTFGIKRYLRELLVLSYLEMRRQDHKFVGRAHIEAAYAGLAFSTTRADIEQVVAGSINPSRLRDDLRCPFGEPVGISRMASVNPHPAVQVHAERVAQAALASLVPPEGNEILDSLDSKQHKSRTQSSAPRRPAPTVQSLLGGAERFSRGGKTKDDSQ